MGKIAIESTFDPNSPKVSDPKSSVSLEEIEENNMIDLKDLESEKKSQKS